MPPGLTLFVMLLAAAAAGWAIARYADPGKRKPGRGLAPDYFRGLNYLLSEQPDKAVDVFVRMAEIDSTTIETHLALGALFRRRGEVERAIRIHQNLIARPNLGKPHREQALFALGEDYLKAGLMDRAESLMMQLEDSAAFRAPALAALVQIYEQQKDWDEAAARREALRKLDGDSAHAMAVAHYCCEMASAALARHDPEQARVLLRRVRRIDRHHVRGLCMRAALAMHDGDAALALGLYRRAIVAMPEIIRDVLPEFDAAVSAAEQDAAAEYGALQGRAPGLATELAQGAILRDAISTEYVLDQVRAYLSSNTTLSVLARGFGRTGSWDESQSVRRLAAALRELNAGQARYACEQCGYQSVIRHWQCPGCRTWGAARALPLIDDGVPFGGGAS